jgi:hypothetical protein
MRLLCLALMLTGSAAIAGTYRNPSYRDVRWLGRGNAGLALVSDGASVFYNPAGLAMNDGYGFDFIDTSIGGNQNIKDSFAELMTLTSGSQTLSEKFSPLLGKPLALQASFFPHLAIPGFLFGGFDYLDVSALYRDPVNPQFNISARNDYGLVTGFATGYQQYFSVGASIRYTNRRAIVENLTVISILNQASTLLNSVQAKGTGFGINLGAQGRFPMGKDSIFALGLTIEDVGQTRFKSKSLAITAPQNQIQSINAGMGIQYKSPVATGRVLLDMRSLGDTTMSYTKKIFTGFEVSTVGADFRAGFFQGYWSAGVTLHPLPLLEIDVATYGEEIGQAAGQRLNRFWLIGFRLAMDLKTHKGKKQKFTLGNL